ncbi:MAG TPA: hypothetical protein VIJ52_07640 [Pseudolabrys sp.]
MNRKFFGVLAALTFFASANSVVHATSYFLPSNGDVNINGTNNSLPFEIAFTLDVSATGPSTPSCGAPSSPCGPSTIVAFLSVESLISAFDQGGSLLASTEVGMTFSDCQIHSAACGGFGPVIESGEPGTGSGFGFNVMPSYLVISTDISYDDNEGSKSTSFAITEFSLTADTPDGVSITPLPSALPLFFTGLAALGLFSWRRKRKAALAA